MEKALFQDSVMIQLCVTVESWCGNNLLITKTPFFHLAKSHNFKMNRTENGNADVK